MNDPRSAIDLDEVPPIGFDFSAYKDTVMVSFTKQMAMEDLENNLIHQGLQSSNEQSKPDLMRVSKNSKRIISHAESLLNVPKHWYTAEEVENKVTGRSNRRYRCLIQGCNKVFSRTSNLKSHFVAHTGARNFQCKVCSKFFSHKANMNAHCKKYHSESY